MKITIDFDTKEFVDLFKDKKEIKKEIPKQEETIKVNMYEKNIEFSKFLNNLKNFHSFAFCNGVACSECVLYKPSDNNCLCARLERISDELEEKMVNKCEPYL